MTTLDRTVQQHRDESDPTEARTRVTGYALGALRLVIGWTFLWAFLDKLFALGFSTGRDPETGVVDRFGDAAWIHGGEPTFGFLSFGADGPFDSLYHGIAGDAWADWLFMAGLLGIGVSLMLGIFMRVGTAAAMVMYLLMWTVVLPPENNPIVDDHVIGFLAVAILGLLGAGHYLGLGAWWNRQSIVRKLPVLR